MQHAPITTPITDKLASMPWIRWFRQLVDRVEEIKGTADAPEWETITGKPTEFPPSEHRHEWTDLDDVPTEFPPEPHTHSQYLTEETDPTVPAHVKGISQADIDLWNATETDPTVPQYVKDITEANIEMWSLASASGGGQAITGVTGAPLGDLTYTPGTLNSPATIDGQTYRQVLMPDGNVWAGENVKGSRYSYTLDSAGYTFRQAGANQLNDWLVANDANGWRVPTPSQWISFGAAISGATYYPNSGYTTSNNNVYYEGYYASPNPSVGSRLKLPSGWASPYNVAPYVSSDEFGFSAKNSDNSPTSATWRCYVPDYDIYTRVWFVADNNGAFFTKGNYEYTSGAHIRLVRPVAEGESLYGSVDVPAFSVRLFPDDAFLGDAKVYSVPAQTIDAPSPDTRYYLCAQRTGDTVSLVFVEHAEVYTINMSNIVPLWRFEIHGTELHQISYDNMGDGLPNKQEFAQLRTEPYRMAIEGGFSVTLGAGRSLTMTGAEVFFGHHRISVLAFDSATDTVHDFFHVAGVWDDTETVGGWAWPNTQYDDGTNLVTMGNNKWSALYVYRSIGDDKELFVVYAKSEANTLESARLIGIPPTPALVQWHSMLVGRILFQKSAATGIFEPYQTATFVRAEAPSLALNDLTDVDTAGAVTGDILVLQSDGIWRPQAP